MLTRSQEKRRKVVDAARHLILRGGVRSTTMEAIAREAGVAKQTLYGYFPDKDAVLGALIEDIIATVCGAVDLGLETDGPVSERIGRALAAKFVTINSFLGGSPHADEIFSEHSRLADRFRAADEAVERQLTAALADVGMRDAQAVARLVMAAAYGVARKYRGEAEVSSGVISVCRAIIDTELASRQ